MIKDSVRKAKFTINHWSIQPMYEFICNSLSSVYIHVEAPMVTK